MTGDERRAAALDALEGLSVGDAFGERFFVPFGEVSPRVAGAIAERRLPPAPWAWTDDTAMAVSVVEVLVAHGAVDQDALAAGFARRYDESRNYGPAMHRLLAEVAAGRSWRDAAPELFEGRGSFGNGSAMRVAPVGAWFAGDLGACVEQAGRSATVTHTHPEAIAGAVAVAVAAAVARGSRHGPPPAPERFVAAVHDHVPPGAVADGLAAAARLAPATPVETAVAELGNGSRISCPDTVPFAVWSASRHLDDYEAALWSTVSGGGDCDTTCAMVGGIVAARLGAGGVPPRWRSAREPLPADGAW